MGWRRDSSAGAAIWDTEPLTVEEVSCRDEEIRWMMAHERQRWGLINGRLAEKGDPTAYGTFAGLGAMSPAGTLANVASLSGEASLWNVSLFTPWLANALVAPSAWQLYVAFQTVTSTTPANLTINPRVGSFTAGASSTGGIALGADGAITLTASITTNWYCEGKVTVQSIGLPGANSKAAGTFNVVAKPASAGNGAATINDIFGFTIASFDASVASGVTLGMANTVTTITYAVTQIHWISLF
jgi:hypothetical protein